MTSENRLLTPTPTLAAFLVGDSVGFIPKPWPRDKFKEALVDTLDAFGDPWVICECKQDSEEDWLTVTKIAMEARREHIEMNCSKPKSFCTTEDALELAKDEDVNDTFCLIGITGENIPIVLSKKRDLPGQFKQLLDKEKTEGCGTVHERMLLLEEKIAMEMVTSLKLNENAEFKMKVPTIVIVIEGDLETVSHVAEAVKRNIPVLLVRGSGMAADLIGYCMNDSEQDTLKTRAPLLFGICFSDEDFKLLKENIKTITEHKRNVTEFNISTDSITSLKDKVTESVLRFWALFRKNITEETTAAIEYQPSFISADVHAAPPPAVYINPHNQHSSVSRRISKVVPIAEGAVRPKTSRLQTSSSVPDYNTKKTSDIKTKPSPVARYMLYQLLQTKHRLHDDEMPFEFGKSLLAYALKENLSDITELLIDKGIKLDWEVAKRKTDGKNEDGKFQYEDGKSLYEEMENERKRCNKNKARACIADIIELKENVKKKEDTWEVGCSIISYKIGKKAKSKAEEEKFMTSSDLLLWAILSNKMKMAEIFWKRSHEPILTALIACAILRKMSRKAHHLNEPEMENKMLLHSRVFRQRAIDVTQKFYENNNQEAIFALELENMEPVWGIQDSALEFSQEHKIYDFVAHHVPQRSFEKIFYGGDFFDLDDFQEPKSVKTCRVCCCCGTRCLRFHGIGTFFFALFTAPASRFFIHYVFFSLFLVCLSAFVMTNITAEKWPIDEKSIYEYCTYLWLFADIVEEYGPPVFNTIYQRLLRSQWTRRAWNHMHNFWNGMDFLSYVVLIIGICVRFLYETTDFGISRKFYTIGLFLMYMRFLHVLLIFRNIGQAVIMLKEGLKELMRFVVIMAVFIISAGVFYHANLYPNHYDMFSTFGIRYWSVWKVIYLPYWSIYGEIKAEIEGDDSTGNCNFNQTVYMNDPDVVRCPEKDWMVSLMSGFFVLILNLLLVNLIIAMFSFRFEEIKNNSDQLWRFHKSQVVLEFQKRIPVPFNLLLRPILVIWFCVTLKKVNLQKEKDLKVRANLDKKQQILARRWTLSESDALRYFDKDGT